jgi:hypothetical protein
VRATKEDVIRLAPSLAFILPTFLSHSPIELVLTFSYFIRFANRIWFSFNFLSNYRDCWKSFKTCRVSKSNHPFILVTFSLTHLHSSYISVFPSTCGKSVITLSELVNIHQFFTLKQTQINDLFTQFYQQQSVLLHVAKP